MLMQGGSKSKPYFYSSYDPDQHYDNSAAADEHDAELTRQRMAAQQGLQNAALAPVQDAALAVPVVAPAEELAEDAEPAPRVRPVVAGEEDQIWEQELAGKQVEVEEAMQDFVPRFEALAGDAQVMVRGSLASGLKGSHKVDPERLIGSLAAQWSDRTTGPSMPSSATCVTFWATSRETVTQVRPTGGSMSSSGPAAVGPPYGDKIAVAPRRPDIARALASPCGSLHQTDGP